METTNIFQKEALNLSLGKEAVRRTDTGKEAGDFDRIMSGQLKKTETGTAEKKEVASRASLDKPVKDTAEKAESPNDSNTTLTDEAAALKKDTVAEEPMAGVLDVTMEEIPVAETGGFPEVTVFLQPVQTPEELPEVPEEIVEALETLVLHTVELVLNVSEEEIRDTLSECEMSVTDLLDPEKLETFILFQNGKEDVTAFLVDETLKENCDILKEAFATITPEDIEGADTEVSEEELSAMIRQLVSGTEQKEPEKAAFVESEGQPAVEVPEENEGKVQITVEKSESQEGSQNETASEESGEHAADTGNDTVAVQESVSENHDPVHTFVENLVQQSGAVTEEVSQGDQVVQYREIVDQVVEQIKIVIKPESTDLTMQLNPEHLGKVSLLMTSKDGQMTASFFVQNELAKEALESNIQTLRENLSSQGLKVEAVSVEISDFSLSDQGKDAFTGNGQADSGKNPANRSGKRTQLRLDELLASEELSEEEEAARDRMVASGSTVDFTA